MAKRVFKRPILDGRAWAGLAEAYGTVFLVELLESRKHPGHYHYAMFCCEDTFDEHSKSPVRVAEQGGVDFWTLFKAVLSKQLGLTVEELDWTEAKPKKLTLLADRVLDGD